MNGKKQEKIKLKKQQQRDKEREKEKRKIRTKEIKRKYLALSTRALVTSTYKNLNLFVDFRYND